VEVDTVVEVAGEPDIIAARTVARKLAADIGFTQMDQSRITTAVSELARNIVRYAVRGTILLREITGERGTGLEVVARDEGPGIPDIARALQPGFTSGSGLGLGLSGTKRLTDEMEITSAPGSGTTVVVRKWKR
jgi:serine/threonine-protein kinase RsbT